MKAFFLDRDGVINESHNVNRADDLVLLPGVLALATVVLWSN